MFKIGFDKAFASMRRGFWVRRSSWQEHQCGIRIAGDEFKSVDEDGAVSIYFPTTGDILADDWAILDVTETKKLDAALAVHAG